MILPIDDGESDDERPTIRPAPWRDQTSSAAISRLRAFAVLLAGDRQRADDLVRETIVQTFTAVKRPHDGISLLVRMFTALRRLHYGALRQSMDVAARQPEAAVNQGRRHWVRRTPTHFPSASRRAA